MVEGEIVICFILMSVWEMISQTGIRTNALTAITAECGSFKTIGKFYEQKTYRG